MGLEEAMKYRNYKSKKSESIEYSFIQDMKEELINAGVKSFDETVFDDKLCSGFHIFSKDKEASSDAVAFLTLSPLIRHSMYVLVN